MFKKLLSVFGLVLLSYAAFSQASGALRGRMIDKTTKEPIAFGNIVVEQSGGKQMGGAATDYDGYYTIKPLQAGTYIVKATVVGYKPAMIQGVVVTTDNLTDLNIEMESTTITITTFVVTDYVVPLIKKDQTTSGGTMTDKEISKMSGRDASSVAATVGGVFKEDGGSTSIRGARTDGTVTYIDGVKVRGSSSLPKSALEQVTVITGGTPAQYGEATGGIINITTKGASRIFEGGLEMVTSQFLDAYGYNLLGFNLQGPLIKGKKDSKSSLLGFFLAGEILYEKDNYPFATGVYKAKDDVLANLEANPLRPSGTGFGSYQNAAFVRLSDLEKMKSKIESPSHGINLSTKIDVTTTENTQLTFGASASYDNSIAYIHDYSLFNYKNFPQSISTTWRVFGRFTQKFPTDTASKSLIKNIYYQIQADYSKYNNTVQDPDFKDNLFKYGHVGKYTTYKARSYKYGNYSALGLTNVYVNDNFYDTLVTFEAGVENPVLANYTSNYYSLYPLNSGYYQNQTIIQNGGALLNGENPSSVYDMWSSPGTVYSSYSKADATTFGFNASLSADIKNHSILFGLQYEQRKDASIGYSPVGLWTRMRQLANKHIEQIDTANPILVTDPYGVFLDTVNFNRLYDGSSQSYFDLKLREALGYAPNGTEWLDVDSYDPSLFNIDWFSADELLNEGYNAVSYYGYDHTGKKLKSKPSFDDFFNKKDANGNYSRLIPAFEPILMSGYIQDKFAFKDLIFNIGVRVDRFDANQMVLKDPYLLYNAKTVGEVNNLGEHPGNIGSDYVVYVDDAKNPSAIKGYRDGNTWYNAQGIEVTDPTLIASNGAISPYLVDPSLTKPNSSAFKDYDPQVSVMPRISFSFPISEKALFYAHYDVITKRPTDGLRLDPTEYYFIQTVTGLGQMLNNPALKPEKTIDYELGFQQLINTKSALKFSAYYKEIRDLVQSYRFYGAYPVNYISFNNLDFGTTKGLTISYDLRQSSNIWMRASYTLQFAEGTGSSATSALSLVSSGQPNLRTINPLDYDRRHAFTMVFDYHYGEGKTYNGPKISKKTADGKVKTTELLKNAGVNFTFRGGSGTPYSRASNIASGILSGAQYVLSGSPNGSRKPWSFTIDARIDKMFVLKTKKKEGKESREMGLTVYMDILNVLNTKNVINVYRSTGNADDDGYLAAAEYQAGIRAQLSEMAYRDLYSVKVNSPYNYSLPRRIRLGVEFNF